MAYGTFLLLQVKVCVENVDIDAKTQSFSDL